MRSSRSSLKPMRCTSPFESRRSAPCMPATGRSGICRNESILSMPRPDTTATAPLVARLSAARMSGTERGTKMPSGVEASSTSVPSKSKKKAVSARDRESGRFASIFGLWFACDVARARSRTSQCVRILPRERFRVRKLSAYNLGRAPFQRASSHAANRLKNSPMATMMRWQRAKGVYFATEFTIESSCNAHLRCTLRSSISPHGSCVCGASSPLLCAVRARRVLEARRAVAI